MCGVCICRAYACVGVCVCGCVAGMYMLGVCVGGWVCVCVWGGGLVCGFRLRKMSTDIFLNNLINGSFVKLNL